MGPLLLAAATAGNNASTAKSVSAGSLFFQLVIALAVILGLIAVMARVMRGRVGNIRKSNAPLAVLGRQTLGKGVQVAIVRAGSDTYVLGVTPHQVSRLGRYVEDPATAELTSSDDLPALPGGAPALVRWQSALRQLQERTVRRRGSHS